MPMYTIDASVRLYGIEVEADSEDDAEEIVRDALNDWMDETYVPMDPAQASAQVDGIIGDEESYSKKPVRGSGGMSAPASRSGKKKAPAKKKGVRR